MSRQPPQSRDALAWERAERALAEAFDSDESPPSLLDTALLGLSVLNAERDRDRAENFAAAIFVHVSRQGHATPQPLGGGMLADPWQCGATDAARVRRNHEKRTRENGVCFVFGGERRVWTPATLSFEPARTLTRYGFQNK